MILGGGYSLWLFNRIAYGNIKMTGLDLSLREFMIFLPLVLGALFMGNRGKGQRKSQSKAQKRGAKARRQSKANTSSAARKQATVKSEKTCQEPTPQRWARLQRLPCLDSRLLYYGGP